MPNGNMFQQVALLPYRSSFLFTTGAFNPPRSFKGTSNKDHKHKQRSDKNPHIYIYMYEMLKRFSWQYQKWKHWRWTGVESSSTLPYLSKLYHPLSSSPTSGHKPAQSSWTQTRAGPELVWSMKQRNGPNPSTLVLLQKAHPFEGWEEQDETMFHPS